MRNTHSNPRVLHLLSLYKPDFTGHGIFWEKMWHNLIKLGGIHDALVVHTPRPKTDTALVPSSNARLFYLNENQAPNSTLRIIKLNRWLLLNLHRYDILHVHTHIDRFFLSHWLSRMLRVPIVYSATLNDTPSFILRSYSGLFRPYAHYMLTRIDYLIANGAQLAEEATRDLGAERVSLIRNGTACLPPSRSREDMRDRMGIPQDAMVLLSVGGICPRKAQHFLIKNHSQLMSAGPACHLVLVGPNMDSDYTDKITNLAKQTGIWTQVHLVGFSDDMSSFYNLADIFVFSSISEGFGNVVSEAMYMGLPVVSRYLVGTTDYFIKNGVTGFLFEDGVSYRHSVDNLICDPELRDRIGRAGARWVRQYCSMSTAATRYQSIYNQLSHTRHS